ncbi:MAG: hypothetical protein JO316_01495 [Abitibacteriaceae bacterium]|nr:hypothetical protein [Abditibacteriaceae bacterium]
MKKSPSFWIGRVMLAVVVLGSIIGLVGCGSGPAEPQPGEAVKPWTAAEKARAAGGGNYPGATKK